MSWLIISFTVIKARKKKIEQQKTMYAMLKNSKPTVGLFFLFINFILNCITNKFTSHGTDNITNRAAHRSNTGENTDGAIILIVVPNVHPAPVPAKAPLSKPSVNIEPPSAIPALAQIPHPGASAPVTPAEILPLKSQPLWPGFFYSLE
ncbi:TPA: hypothetical protein ACOEF8_003204 [Enterobacter roggenkampii]